MQGLGEVPQEKVYPLNLVSFAHCGVWHTLVSGVWHMETLSLCVESVNFVCMCSVMSNSL